VQTGKSPPIPIVLVGSEFWAGLIDWFKTTLTDEGTISAEDVDLFITVDKPEEVVDAIFAHYENRGFEPSEEEQEKLLQL